MEARFLLPVTEESLESELPTVVMLNDKNVWLIQ